jgi:hypothetical protein
MGRFALNFGVQSRSQLDRKVWKTLKSKVLQSAGRSGTLFNGFYQCPRYRFSLTPILSVRFESSAQESASVQLNGHRHPGARPGPGKS